MSVEVFAYSEDSKVLDRSILAKQLKAADWEILFLPCWPQTQTADHGCCGDDLLIGCESSSDLSAIRDLIFNRDPQGIERLLGEDGYANCALEIENPYEFAAYYGEDDVDRLLSELGCEHVEAMKRAATMYCVRIHGMQNELSGHLQEAVWKSLGRLCGGLMYDPQTGKSYIEHTDEARG